MGAESLVGREAELEQLRALLARARAGAGGTALVVAEPGGGKTALVTAAALEAESAGTVVLWATASEATATVPWLPISVALSNGLAAVDADALIRRLGPRHRTAAIVAPALFPDTTPPAVDEAARTAVFEAVLSVLAEFDAGQGVVLVIDDLQWADATTQQLVSHLTARAGHHRLALLVTWRDSGEDGTLAGLLRQPGVLGIRPRPLDQSDLVRLGLALMGSRPRPDVVAQVARLSAGNPFAATELLIASDREALPANVRDAVLGRARGLPAVAVRALQAASVLDREFDAALVSRVAGQPVDGASAALGRLVDGGLLERTVRGRHRFRHALIANAVRSEMDDAGLRAAHTAAATALEELDAPRAELAHHLFAAGRDDKAVPLAVEAANAAEAAGANVEASLLFERAAQSTVDVGSRGDLLDRAAFNALVAFQIDRAQELAETAIAWLRHAGRPAARAHATLGQTLARQASMADADEQTRLALADLQGAPPSAYTAHVYMMLAARYMALFQAEEAISLADRAVSAADAAGDERTSVLAQGVIATCTGILGRLDEGIRLTDEATEWALQRRLYMPSLAGFHNACQLRGAALRGREALTRLENLSRDRRALLGPEIHRVEAHLFVSIAGPRQTLRAADEASLTATPGDIARMALIRAVALVELDRPLEALELLERTTTDSGVIHTRLRSTVMALVAAGRAGDAMDNARQMLSLPLAFPFWTIGAEAAAEALMAAGQERAAVAALRERRSEADEANPWWQLAQARVSLPGDHDAGRRLAAAAGATFEAAGYPLDSGRANLVLAEAERAAGDLDAARTALHRVLATAKEYGIDLHARLARERLAALGDRADRLDAEAVRRLLEGLEQLPAERRRQVLEAVDGLVLAGGRHGEAGALLRDYYVKKVGSQEVVAERHFLTRPTFYRRLHLGWELLAERLGPLDEAPTVSR